MQQYFVNEALSLNEPYYFNKEQAHHVKDVLRMNPNTIVRLVYQEEAFFAAIGYENNKPFALVQEKDERNHDMDTKITLIVGLIKKDKWDLLLQKVTELGVTSIVPFESSRTVVKSVDEKVTKKMDRWNTILKEASEQCKRNSIPTLLEPISFSSIEKYKTDINVVAYEDLNHISKKMRDVLKKGQNVSIVIGPEGGFSLEEIEALCAKGFECVNLGQRILRAETAAMYACAAVDAIEE